MSPSPARCHVADLHIIGARLRLYASVEGVTIETEAQTGLDSWVPLDPPDVLGHPSALASYLERVAPAERLVVAVVRAWATARAIREGALTLDAEWCEIP